MFSNDGSPGRVEYWCVGKDAAGGIHLGLLELARVELEVSFLGRRYYRTLPIFEAFLLLRYHCNVDWRLASMLFPHRLRLQLGKI